MPNNYYNWLDYISGLDLAGYKDFIGGPQYANFVNSARQFSADNKIARITGIPMAKTLSVPTQTGITPVYSKTGPNFLQKLKLAGSNIDMNQVNGIVSGISGFADIIGDAVETGKGEFSREDLENWNKEQNNSLSFFNKAAGNSNTTSDLLRLTNMEPDFQDAANDIETSTYNFGKTISSAGKGALAGASIGSVVPVVGTAVGAIGGAIIGGVSDLFGQGFGIFGDKNRKNDALNRVSMLDNMVSASKINAGNRVSTNTYRQGMANYLNNAAMGGPLFTHGSDFTDDLIRIDAGGTHEQNPFGGVPAGVDPQGIPNLVEEGEIIWDDYVFSDRLKMPKSLMKKYKLGGRKGKAITFAEGVDKISEKLGTELRPNDYITQNTKDEILSEFEGVQEEKRLAQQKRNLIKAMSEMTPEEFQAMMAPEQTEQQPPMMEEQMPPQGMEQQPMPEEPIGLMAPGMAAFGGHILDGTKGESRRITKELAGPYRLPGVGVIGYRDLYDKEVEMHKDEKGRWWVNGRMVGTNEGDAQRYARQIANARASLNMSRNLEGQAEVSTERKALSAPKGKAVSSATLPERRQNLFVTPYLDADLSEVQKLRQQPIPNNEYDVIGAGRFLPDDYAPFFGRIHAPGNLEPGWSLRGYTPDEKKETPVSTEKKDAPVVTTSTGRASTGSVKDNWTPRAFFAEPVANPVDTYRSRSFMFNPPATRSAVQKAVEGVSPEDPEYTASKGAMDNKMLPTWMRYAPIIGGGISVLGDLFNRPDYSGYNRLLADAERAGRPVSIPVTTIGNKIRRNPFDERLAVNQANQNFLAAVRGTLDTSGGNRAYRQFATSQLARDNQSAKSDIARNAYLANRQDALQTADFNRQTDLYNMNAINQRNLTEAQLNSGRQYQGFMARANALNALENARRYDDSLISADFTTLMQNLGNLGRENFAFNQQAALAREGLDRLRYLGTNGNMVFNPETQTWVTVGKCGGKIKTKKRRF